MMCIAANTLNKLMLKSTIKSFKSTIFVAITLL
jgi:hypothetical protein